MYTQTFQENGYFYASSEITIYDAKHEEQGKITVTIEDGHDVNDIQPFGVVTNNFFDKDASTNEVLVYVHEVGDSYNSINTIQVYHTDGTLVTQYDASQSAIFDASSSYRRMILVNEGTDEQENSVYNVSLYKSPGYGDTEPTVEHTLTIDEDKTINTIGQFVNAYAIDGKPYYVVTNYNKPYYTGEWDDNWQMILTDDNALDITVYDRNLEVVSQISIPLVHPTNTYRMMGFGFLSDNDLTIGRFTNDNDFNFVVSIDDYNYLDDSDKFSFLVYNGKGELVKTICENVDSDGILKLSDISGEEEQWAFGETLSTGVQQLRMVNIPSCETVATLPSTLDGNSITTTMDRYKKGDSYQYVIGLGSASTDESGNVYGQIGWYNSKDLSTDKVVKFNLGQNGIYFRPNISSTTLTPYLFNTDDDLEYAYLSYIGRGDGTSINDTHLTIADKNGNTIKDYVGDDTKGSIQSVVFLNTGTANASMLIGYLSSGTSSDYNFEIIPLPFEKFTSGGDGTAENPYIVSSLGDLLQVKNEPAAHYRQNAHINMKGYDWEPIESFSGTYDGDNNTISYLTIENSDAYDLGLFGMLEYGSSVKNLIINSASITIPSGSAEAGVLAGMAMQSTVENVHVNSAYITTASSDLDPTNVGGLIGQATVNTTINSCSFNDGTIYTPAATNVGGIAGQTRTSTAIQACAVSGSLTAQSVLGGIVGDAGMNAGSISDSHANTTLLAENTVGGIAGSSNRGGIYRTYSEGTIEVTTPDTWTGLCAGGIAGSLSVDFTGATDAVVSSSLANISEIITPDGSDDDATVNRIVGYSVNNEPDYVDAGLSELGLADNYANSALLIHGSAAASGTATDVNGESVEAEALTTAFFQNLGYVYGSTTEQPWTGEGIPTLYYEGSVDGGIDNAFANSNINSILTVANGIITANGATAIELFSVAGYKVAEANAAQLDATGVARGIYIAVVTDNAGKKQAQKVVIQ